MLRSTSPPTMDFRRIVHFLTVAECGSISKAARRLHISQPALTKSIQLLEQSLGATLFERSIAGMTVNQYGELLKQRASRIAVEAAWAEAEIGQMLDARRGHVRMSVSPSFASALLPRALARFRAVYPDVEITATEGSTDDAAIHLLDGTLDFAIGTLSPGLASTGLTTQPLYSERVVVVSSSANPLASRRHVTASEAWPGPWLMGSPGVFREQIGAVFAKAQLPMPRAAVTYATIGLAKSILRQGDYLGMLSVNAIIEEIEADSLRIVRAPDLTWERSVGVALRDRASLMPAAKALLDQMCATCAETGPKRSRSRTAGVRHQRT